MYVDTSKYVYIISCRYIYIWREHHYMTYLLEILRICDEVCECVCVCLFFFRNIFTFKTKK